MGKQLTCSQAEPLPAGNYLSYGHPVKGGSAEFQETPSATLDGDPGLRKGLPHMEAVSPEPLTVIWKNGSFLVSS